MRINIVFKSFVLFVLISSLVSAATTRLVPSGSYPKIQDAIDVSSKGDTVVILPGTYQIANGGSTGNLTVLYVLNDITIRSQNPADPCTVAATVIQGGFAIDASPNISGLTIEGRYYYGHDGCSGGNTSAPFCDSNYPIKDWPQNPWKKGDPNGQNGWSIEGGGMRLYGNSSPNVTYCVFNRCAVQASNGGDGSGKGWGGWAGHAYGGAVYVDGGSPTFKNCDFIGCTAVGGDGGNNTTTGGRGGSWGSANEPQGDPNGHPRYGWKWAPNGGYREIWRYSGLGGAVYCEANSTPTFTNCNFVNNKAVGGSCGLSDPGIWPWPQFHYKIPRMGGAVFCTANSAPDFNNCMFTGNQPDPNNDDLLKHHKNGAGVASDPYVGFGGAVAYEDDSNPTFTNCTFIGNDANEGGAIYNSGGIGRYAGCTIRNNSAFIGGGICAVDSSTAKGTGMRISGGTIASNSATSNGASTGYGGGIYMLGCIDPNITGAIINYNTSAAEGGGIYTDSSGLVLTNSYITSNSAVNGGGGLSIAWDSYADINNCTITGNNASGIGGYGGGINVAYSSDANIANSTIQGNLAQYGPQIAIGPDVFTPYSSMSLINSTLEGGLSQVYHFNPGNTLNWKGPPSPNPMTFATLPYYTTNPSGVRMIATTAAGDSAVQYFFQRYTANGSLDSTFSGSWSSSATFLDTKATKSGVTYGYTVKARDTAGTTVPSPIAYVTVAVTKTKPNPNPMTWAAPPDVNSTWVRVYAATATAATGVEYQFQRSGSPSYTSGWQSSPIFLDTGLRPGSKYSYRVHAREMSPKHNTTSWSAKLSVMTLTLGGQVPDTIAPVWPGTYWATYPMESGSNFGFPFYHTMACSTATDANSSIIQYRFICVNKSALSSSWQTSTSYTVFVGFAGPYYYVWEVQAKDAFGNTTSAAPSAYRIPMQ